MASLQLPISSYRLPSPAASAARLVNCFPEMAPKDTKKQPVILRRAPGIRAFANVGAGPIRGFTVMGGVLFALSGTTLYSVDGNGTGTAVSGSVPGAERVQMANNGTDLVISRPFNSFGYQSDGATVSQIVDSTFTGWGGLNPTFLDDYIVFRRPGTQQFFNTGLGAITFNALDITSADGDPDNLVGLAQTARELFLPGEKTCEIWYNAANPTGSPFSRSPTGFIEVGCAAGDSVGKQDNGLFWLANDKTFRRLEGLAPTRVSNHGIEAVLERMAVVSDCFALPYSQEGHLFVAFTFPSAGRTIVYDALTQQWHDRESYGLGRWRPNAIAGCYGKQLVGDSQSGKIGILAPDTHYEWDDPQRVEWTYQPAYAERQRASFRRFELVLNTGEGVTVGQGQNPLATLKISDDGGKTYRTLPTRSLGEVGKYKTSVAWWNTGSARERVHKVEITDPVPLYVTDTQIEGDGLRI